MQCCRGYQLETEKWQRGIIDHTPPGNQNRLSGPLGKVGEIWIRNENCVLIFVRIDLGIVVIEGKKNEFSASTLHGLNLQGCDKLIIRKPPCITLFFKKYIYLFIWLHRVLVAAHRIFSRSMWDLDP